MKDMPLKAVSEGRQMALCKGMKDKAILNTIKVLSG